MIKLQCSRFDAAGVPVLSDAEINRFAHTVLTDYKPDLLKEPGRINYTHFLESYLGANLIYQDIYNENPDKPILGMTVFTEGNVKVFDREKLCVKEIWMDERTVILDNFVTQEGKEGLELFTALHESGHLCLDTGNNADVECFDFDWLCRQISCYKENIENFASSRRKRTPKEWKEHHADCFAACIAMPDATFIPLIRQALRDNDIWKPQVFTGKDEDTDYIAEDLLPELISETYGVSKRAAFIKLIKCGFVVDRKPRKA